MRSTVLFLLVAMSVAACRQRAVNTAAAQQVRPTYDKQTGQLTRLEADRDGDGKVDTWGFMKGARIVRLEIDENGDGKVDRWEFYRQDGTDGRPDKTIERVERATRFDGIVSRREFFDHGALMRVEEDTNGDGKLDKWETYNDGSLSTMTLDTTHRGTPDRRLIYRPDGTLDRIETDPTGSGNFQPVSSPPRP
jgi:hypothetical protein